LAPNDYTNNPPYPNGEKDPSDQPDDILQNSNDSPSEGSGISRSSESVDPDWDKWVKDEDEDKVRERNEGPEHLRPKVKKNVNAPSDEKPHLLKPKRPSSAWIFYSKEKMSNLIKKDGLKLNEALTKSSKNWKLMSDDDKKPYVAMKLKDEDRYKRQMTELNSKGYYTTEDGKKSTDLPMNPRLKYGRNAVLPKKPLSTYFIYTHEKVKSIKEKEGCSHTDAIGKCGKLWKGLSEKDKKKYEVKREKYVTKY